MEKEIIRKILKEEVELLKHGGDENLNYLKDMILQSLKNPKENEYARTQSQFILNLKDFFQQMYSALEQQAPHLLKVYNFHNISQWRDLGNGEQEKGMLFLSLLKGLMIDYNLLGDEWRGMVPDTSLENSGEVHDIVIDLANIITK